MKHTKRILCALLTLCMVVCAIPAFCFTTVAEEAEEVNLAAEYAVSMMINGRDDVDSSEALAMFTDGNCDDYWTMGANWTEEVCDHEDHDVHCGTPTLIAQSECYVEADLGAECKITAISAGFISGRIYKWEAYVTNDNTLPITEWTKVAEKTNNDVEDGNGYKDTLESPVSARYVRLYGTYNSANRGVHLAEFGIWGPEPAPKPVMTASEATNIMANGIATVRKSDRDVTDILTDGETDLHYWDDYWSAYGTPDEDSVEDEHSWFEVDLHGKYVVDAFTVIERLTKGSSYELNDYYTNWEVYATVDASAPISEWTKVGEKKNEIAVSEDGYTVEFEQPVVARYLRVYCTKTTSEVSSQFQVSEIEVWTGMKSMVKFEGYQVGGEEGNNIRFAASINNPDLVSVGMKIEVASAKKVFNCEDNKVCKTLQFVNEYGETKNAVSVDPEAGAEYVVDAEYLYGFVITGVASGTYEFVITPMATMADGTVYQGETVTVEITI